MDPEANLREQLELAESMVDNPEESEEHVDDMCNDGRRLAELVLALNEWITKGGFLPTSWKRG